MLMGIVYMYNKIIDYFFLEEYHPQVSSAKMTDALASYICNYKF